MIVFNFDMTPIYKNEYDWGWIDKAILASYVKQGLCITADGYKEITGDDYVEQAG